MSLNQVDAVSNGFAGTSTFYDNSRIFVHSDFGCLTQGSHSSILEFQTKIFCDDCSACQNGDIFQHRLATVTKAWRLHCYDIECSTDFVENQGRQGLTIHIIRNDEKRSIRLENFFQKRKNVLDVGNLFICNENEWIFQIRHHFFIVCYHILGEVAAIKLHPFYHFQLCFHTAGFFDGNDTIFTHALHGFRNVVSYFFRTGRYGRYLGDSFLIGNGLGDGLQFFHCCCDCLFNPAANTDRVGSGSHIFQAFANDGLGQNSCGGRSVSCDVIGF